MRQTFPGRSSVRKANLTVSVIVCTRDRAEHLQKTLAAIGRVRVPRGMGAELIVVDNGSRDGTADLVRSCRLPGITAVRWINEPRPGLSNARNAGIAAAAGELLLFTDDDVRPPQDWIEGMCAPLLDGQAHAVAGGVTMAPHLLRPWMTPDHRRWLAATECFAAGTPLELTGANMAVSRAVLTRVPGFDPELGAGTPFCGEELLFSYQLARAGFRIEPALDVAVEHHFEESRLLRDNFLAFARRLGRQSAYITHHWDHGTLAAPQRYLVAGALRLARGRLRNRRECAAREGMPIWEMAAVQKVYLYRQYLIERTRPRNYERHGLVRRDHTAYGGQASACAAR